MHAMTFNTFWKWMINMGWKEYLFSSLSQAEVLNTLQLFKKAIVMIFSHIFIHKIKYNRDLENLKGLKILYWFSLCPILFAFYGRSFHFNFENKLLPKIIFWMFFVQKISISNFEWYKKNSKHYSWSLSNTNYSKKDTCLCLTCPTLFLQRFGHFVGVYEYKIVNYVDTFWKLVSVLSKFLNLTLLSKIQVTYV